MIQDKSIESLKTFLASAKENFSAFIDSIDMDACKKAAEIILDSQANGNRIHVTGIGKPGHVAAYAASLLSSTGNPATFLHGTEAVHGSCYLSNLPVYPKSFHPYQKQSNRISTFFHS